MPYKQQKPEILSVKSIAKSALFNVEQVELSFSNGQQRIYERMKPSARQAVMIVPVLQDDLLLVKEYAVAIEDYELGFPKGAVEPDEDILAAANRELMEEIGYGANKFTVLTQLTTIPSHFSNLITIVLAEDLYPAKLEGDEPEPLLLVKWPKADMMALLKEPDFREARNVSALFLARELFTAES
jgi:ADP-ribose diphosphatase